MMRGGEYRVRACNTYVQGRGAKRRYYHKYMYLVIHKIKFSIPDIQLIERFAASLQRLTTKKKRRKHYYR